jgi:hypothetical protein
MARTKSSALKPPITDKEITGLKYFEKLLPLFERLHEVGCERDTAGNRDLHFDEYCCLVLLFFFNPKAERGRLKGRRSHCFNRPNSFLPRSAAMSEGKQRGQVHLIVLSMPSRIR